CAGKGVGFQWVRVPPGNWSLQPEAIGAAVEVTKPSEPSMERIALGDPVSKQAVTRVNAEQASKSIMWMPTRPHNGEGRCCGILESDNPHRSTGVVATACLREETNATQETSCGGGVRPPTGRP
ncbi:MAG TPA: hypothetical protein VF131_00100, partial [Blastocatellia bacterium]|nr:hypothetical protein [Blastocatellia bacterium]